MGPEERGGEPGARPGKGEKPSKLRRRLTGEEKERRQQEERRKEVDGVRQKPSAETGVSEKYMKRRHIEGTGLPPDPWSDSHSQPDPRKHDQRGDNGGYWGRGPLRMLYEHPPMTPSYLPPEHGRTSDQGYHGREGYRGGEVPQRANESSPSRRWLLPVLVVLAVAIAYLLSTMLAG
ncbi:MAG: hypothetical protein ACOC0J_00010 [Myxococcota bacterium]